MKHTTDLLLLAAAVREVAKELRTNAHSQAKQAAIHRPALPQRLAIEYGISAEQWVENQAAEAAAEEAHFQKSKNFDRDWSNDNPLSNFIKPALQELETVASLITDPNQSATQPR